MNLKDFTDQHKQALLDLLVAGMYADGKLASIEDAKIQGLLDTLRFPSGMARNQCLDASVTRARMHAGSPESVRAFVADIAKQFPTPELRRQACDALVEVFASDKELAEKESQLLAVVKDEFKL
jgi:uncharacterized tellurite resistance protein B-like protein